LNDVDCGIGRYRIAQAVAVTHEFPIYENNHMLPDSPLLVQDVPAGALVLPEIIVKNSAKSRAGGFPGGTCNMTLDILRETYGRQILALFTAR
jgi:hypothetical protein